MSDVVIIAIVDQITDIKRPWEIQIADINIKDKRSINIVLINKDQRGI